MGQRGGAEVELREDICRALIQVEETCENLSFRLGSLEGDETLLRVSVVVRGVELFQPQMAAVWKLDLLYASSA